VCEAAIYLVVDLATYGMSSCRSRPLAEHPSDDIGTAIINSGALSEIIALINDSSSDMRRGAIEAVAMLAIHGASFLQDTATC
jgi:hypothetical protein